MIGHLFFPNIDPIYPATLSKRLVDDLLRVQLKFDGLVVTDALVMNSISKKYRSGSAALMAFDAGVDLLLMPEDIDEAIDTLTDAFYSEKISLERLNRSRKRREKQIDLISNQNEIDNEDLHNEFLLEASKFSKSIIKESIYVSKKSIKEINNNDINLIKVDNFDHVMNKFAPALSYPRSLGFKNLIVHPNSISPLQKNNKFVELEQISNGKILIQLFARGRPFIGLDYDNDKWLEAIKKWKIDARLLGVIVYGCPYLYDKIKHIISDFIPLAYSPSQTEDAQNQILSRIFQPKIDINEIDNKSINEFTD
tara:strand:- start:945 stop:1874 length:930 start_codon:yes stop_codon:yes gene_type:complete